MINKLTIFDFINKFINGKYYILYFIFLNKFITGHQGIYEKPTKSEPRQRYNVWWLKDYWNIICREFMV